MSARTAVVALLFVLLPNVGQPALADVVIPYNEYSASPTIGRGNGTSTDPNQSGYGAMRIFIQKVMDYTSALPSGQKGTFRPDRSTGRAVNALRAGVQFANQGAQPHPIVSEPIWGPRYNSVPFGMSFAQMLEFLYNAKLDGMGRNGIALAQALLDQQGGTQIIFPVVGSTMQGSGYFPRPIGKPLCHTGSTSFQGVCLLLAFYSTVGVELPIPAFPLAAPGRRAARRGEGAASCTAPRPAPHLREAERELTT